MQSQQERGRKRPRELRAGPNGTWYFYDSPSPPPSGTDAPIHNPQLNSQASPPGGNWAATYIAALNRRVAQNHPLEWQRHVMEAHYRRMHTIGNDLPERDTLPGEPLHPGDPRHPSAGLGRHSATVLQYGGYVGPLRNANVSQQSLVRNVPGHDSGSSNRRQNPTASDPGRGMSRGSGYGRGRENHEWDSSRVAGNQSEVQPSTAANSSRNKNERQLKEKPTNERGRGHGSPAAARGDQGRGRDCKSTDVPRVRFSDNVEGKKREREIDLEAMRDERLAKLAKQDARKGNFNETDKKTEQSIVGSIRKGPGRHGPQKNLTENAIAPLPNVTNRLQLEPRSTYRQPVRRYIPSAQMVSVDSQRRDEDLLLAVTILRPSDNVPTTIAEFMLSSRVVTANSPFLKNVLQIGVQETTVGQKYSVERIVLLHNKDRDLTPQKPATLLTVTIQVSQSASDHHAIRSTFRNFCHILHGVDEQIPKNLTIQEAINLWKLVQETQSSNAVIPWMKMWSANPPISNLLEMKHMIPDCSMQIPGLLYLAWMARDDVHFRYFTGRMIQGMELGPLKETNEEEVIRALPLAQREPWSSLPWGVKDLILRKRGEAFEAILYATEKVFQDLLYRVGNQERRPTGCNCRATYVATSFGLFAGGLRGLYGKLENKDLVPEEKEASLAAGFKSGKGPTSEPVPGSPARPRGLYELSTSATAMPAEGSAKFCPEPLTPFTLFPPSFRTSKISLKALLTELRELGYKLTYNMLSSERSIAIACKCTPEEARFKITKQNCLYEGVSEQTPEDDHWLAWDGEINWNLLNTYSVLPLVHPMGDTLTLSWHRRLGRMQWQMNREMEVLLSKKEWIQTSIIPDKEVKNGLFWDLYLNERGGGEVRVPGAPDSGPVGDGNQGISRTPGGLKDRGPAPTDSGKLPPPYHAGEFNREDAIIKKEPANSPPSQLWNISPVTQTPTCPRADRNTGGLPIPAAPHAMTSTTTHAHAHRRLPVPSLPSTPPPGIPLVTRLRSGKNKRRSPPDSNPNLAPLGSGAGENSGMQLLSLPGIGAALGECKENPRFGDGGGEVVGSVHTDMMTEKMKGEEETSRSMMPPPPLPLSAATAAILLRSSSTSMNPGEGIGAGTGQTMPEEGLGADVGGRVSSTSKQQRSGIITIALDEVEGGAKYTVGLGEALRYEETEG